MKDLKLIETRIKRLEERNEVVGANKAWETSITRRVLISLFTYIAVSLYMNAIGIPDPWLNAIIPTVGFLLSTLSLPFFKDIWVKYIYKK